MWSASVLLLIQHADQHGTPRAHFNFLRLTELGLAFFRGGFEGVDELPLLFDFLGLPLRATLGLLRCIAAALASSSTLFNCLLMAWCVLVLISNKSFTSATFTTSDTSACGTIGVRKRGMRALSRCTHNQWKEVSKKLTPLIATR